MVTKNVTHNLMLNNVKNLRTQHGWSQKKLAEAILCDRQTIIRVENGKTKLSPEVCRRIAALFSVSESYVMGADYSTTYVTIIDTVPCSAPLDKTKKLLNTRPVQTIRTDDLSEDIGAFIIKDSSMNKAGIEGQLIIVDFTKNTPSGANGAYVLAEVQGQIVFRRFFAPDRLESESNLPIPPYTGEFKILGRVARVQHDFFQQ
jgi:putative transcriptional regulator